jgi:hypothetical protein
MVGLWFFEAAASQGILEQLSMMNQRKLLQEMLGSAM